MTEIVIIGAGLTGLSAAYHLEQNNCFDYKLFEKEATVGGLCRSIQTDGFTFDYTGHLLHISDDYFKAFIAQHVGFDNLNSIDRRSFIYSHDRYTNYPYQINLHGLPPEIITECITEFINRPKNTQQPTNFKDWVLHNFGAGFGKHFFFPYQTKIFDFPVKQLSSSWTGRFVPQTTLKQMLMGALQNQPKPVGYNSQFFYPKQGGIFYWIQQLTQHIKQPILTNQTVSSIDLKNKIVLFKNGSTESYKKLITTMPLDSLSNMLKEPSDSTLKQAGPHLKCNSVVNVNLGINRPNISDKHWIYYPEKQYPFYRVGFWHNFGSSMAPKNCSSLYAEFSHFNRPQKEVAEKLKETLKQIKKLFTIKKSEILIETVLPVQHAYVIFDEWRDKNLPKILTQLEEHDIYSVGRYGAWKYSSMQEGLLDGKAIAEQLTLTPQHKYHEKILQQS